ncbi:MAG: PhzF family phenazine biosynthesis protein [Alkalibacterium sp.]|nr:PhzF family phenazine biosynthesis protein [Alkalibacterium sp.]
MNSQKIYHYDAFSKQPDKGNPAGIVLNGDHLTTSQMQNAAFKVGFNETAFPLKSDVADIRIRYFSPKREMDLCGHATIAALYALKTNGLLPEKESLTIETKAGILPVTIASTPDNDWTVRLSQSPAQFKPFDGSIKAIARAIGLEESEIDQSLPALYGNTGSWTLLVPVKRLASFDRMNPRTKDFPDLLEAYPNASIHPFCLETSDPSSDMHGRHFSSPSTGSVEDSVTGTASGAMGAYYCKYIADSYPGSRKLVVEQGHEMGKDGRVYVAVSKNRDTYDVTIAGQAIFVKEFDVQID